MYRHFTEQHGGKQSKKRRQQRQQQQQQKQQQGNVQPHGLNNDKNEGDEDEGDTDSDTDASDVSTDNASESLHGNLQNTNYAASIEDDQIRREYEINAPHIRAPTQQNGESTIYNFVTNDLNAGNKEFSKHLGEIFENEQNSFRINLSFGLILRDSASEDRRVRYFIPHTNETLFERSETVNNRRDLENLKRKIEEKDVGEHLHNSKNSSQWKVQMVTNINYNVTPTNFPLGSSPVDLPNFIVKKKSIVPLHRNCNNESYTDNLCMFRALYYHRHGRIDSEGVLDFYHLWCTSNATKRHKHPSLFKGVAISDFPRFEDVFQVSLNVFELHDDNTAVPRYLSSLSFDDVLYLNLYDTHISYVKNVQNYLSKFSCPNCSRNFETLQQLKRHHQSCTGSKRLTFPGKFLSAPNTIFDDLEQFGVFYPSKMKVCEHFAVFDFESILVKRESTRVSAKVHVTHEHFPVSCAVHSSVPGFDSPEFFLDDNVDELLKVFLNHLHKISSASEEILRDRYWRAFETLASKIKQMEAVCPTSIRQKPQKNLNQQDVSNEAEIEVTAAAKAAAAANIIDSRITSESTLRSSDDESSDCDSESSCNSFIDDNAVDADNSNLYENPYLEQQNHLSEVRVIDAGPQADVSDTFISQASVEASEFLTVATETPNTVTTNTTTSTNASATAIVGDSAAPSSGPMREAISNAKSVLLRLEKYCCTLPVLGFNSERYDLPLIMTALAKHLCLDTEREFCVKRGASYKCLQTRKLKFLDIRNFVSPNCSYDQFVRAYTSPQQQVNLDCNKSFFPYEWFDCIEKLQEEQLPPPECFESTLRRGNVLGSSEIEIEENYNQLLLTWRNKGMKNMEDYLRHYNIQDVIGFVEAVKTMLENYFAEEFDLFKRTISLPNYARNHVFRTCNTIFPIFDYKDADLYKIYRASSAGGPSIVFSRHARRDETFIRNNPLKPVKKIIGWDMNNMYGYCIAQDMPTGVFVQYHRVNLNGGACQFRADVSTKYMDMYFWMDYVAETENVRITHKLNNKMRETKIKNFYCDGFSVSGEQITVYEYDSCYYHFDCPHCNSPPPPAASQMAATPLAGDRLQQTFQQQQQQQKQQQLNDFQLRARQRTRDKRNYLESLGIRVITMHECQFKKFIRPKIQHIVDRYMPPNFRPGRRFNSERALLKAVRDGRLFGAVYCDLQVPEKWSTEPQAFRHATMTPHEYFEEMSPIFCVSDVNFENFGEHMKDFCREAGLSSTLTRRLLVGGMRAERLLVSTSLLCWYMKHGIEVTAVHRAIQFTPRRCFSRFVEKGTQMRRVGDANPDKKMLSEKYKLFVNSLFGSFLRNKERERSLFYVRGARNLRMKANDPSFVQCRRLDHDYHEVEMLKKRIRLDNPVYLGHAILNKAKELLLDFYFSFLDRYFSREDFQLMCCDTDSLYVAFSSDDIETLVRPERRTEYYNFLYGSCSQNSLQSSSSSSSSSNLTRERGKQNDGDGGGGGGGGGGEVHNSDEAVGRHLVPPSVQAKPHLGFFLTRNCCERDRKWDAREPGLWKTEATGNEMLCLASKTYLLVQQNETVGKLTCKGANKSAVENAVSTFRNVLSDKAKHEVENRGIRSMNEKIVTYQQQRNAFHYMYVKRTVCNDGVSTIPVDMTLTPWRQNFFLVDETNPLSMWRVYKTTTTTTTTNTGTVQNNFCRAQSTNSDPAAVSGTTLEYDGKMFFCFMQLALYIQLLHDNTGSRTAAAAAADAGFDNGRRFGGRTMKITAQQILNCKDFKKLRYFESRCFRQCSYYSKQKAYDVVFDVLSSLIEPQRSGSETMLASLLSLPKNKPIISIGLDRYWSCGMTRGLAQVSRLDEFPGVNNFGKILKRLRDAIS